MTINGGCLCGGVKYRMADVPLAIENCHCSMCRKAHGSAYATFAMTTREGFAFTAGADLVETYQSSPLMQRSFCRNCGSRLTVAWAKVPDYLWVPLGSFDDDPGMRPQFHIFVGSKAPWHEINDDLPQHDAYPPPGD